MWATLNPGRDVTDASVFFEVYNRPLPEVAEEATLLARWAKLREVRAAATKAIEAVRESGGVGSSLQAELVVEAPENVAAELARLGDDLKFVFITSQATVRLGRK